MSQPNASKKRPDSASIASTSKKTRSRQSPLPLQPKKTYTIKELHERNHEWARRYQKLLDCARRNDVSAVLLLPTVKEFEISMAKNCVTLSNKVELLDIYHYLVDRWSDPLKPITFRNFGKMIGVKLPSTTLYEWLQNEKAIRDKAVELPEGACYMVKRKNELLETVLVKWMEKQRNECLPVSGKMFRSAAEVTYTVLQDCFEDKDGNSIGTP
ncbi:hypothetical protein BGX29_003248, partial [Mortierella sp. GBA35]